MLQDFALFLSESATDPVKNISSAIDSDFVKVFVEALDVIVDDAVALVKAGMPYGLTLAGLGLAVTYGLKVFKKFSKS